jgi:hypothetical protein
VTGCARDLIPDLNWSVFAGVVCKKRSQSFVINKRCCSSDVVSDYSGLFICGVLEEGSRQNYLVKVEKFILAHFVF